MTAPRSRPTAKGDPLDAGERILERATGAPVALLAALATAALLFSCGSGILD